MRTRRSIRLASIIVGVVAVALVALLAPWLGTVDPMVISGFNPR